VHLPGNSNSSGQHTFDYFDLLLAEISIVAFDVNKAQRTSVVIESKEVIRIHELRYQRGYDGGSLFARCVGGKHGRVWEMFCCFESLQPEISQICCDLNKVTSTAVIVPSAWRISSVGVV